MASFDAACSEIEADLKHLQALELSAHTLLPVCGGVALVSGKILEGATIRLGEDLYVKVKTKCEAIEILTRKLQRLKFGWLEQLEADNDEEGLKAFEKRFHIDKQASKSDGKDEEPADLRLLLKNPEPLFFEPNKT